MDTSTATAIGGGAVSFGFIVLLLALIAFLLLIARAALKAANDPGYLTRPGTPAEKAWILGIFLATIVGFLVALGGGALLLGALISTL